MLAALIALHGCAGAPAENARNVILVSIDTCRADHLGCYGNPDGITPHIDRFAERAVLFENVISPVPVTLPAHSSMLTGTIPPYHGVHENIDYRLGPSNVTLAEILGQHGFRTAAMVGSFVLDSRFGLDQGFETYDDRFEDVYSNLFGPERRCEETTRLALRWLEEHREDRSFLFLHYYDPHRKYDPPEPFASRFADDLYAGEIAYVDDCIGQVFGKLKELDLYDSALILVLADHGEMLGEHGEPEHGFFIYQSAIKVPMIIKLPEQSEPKRVPHLVGLVDLVPTVCGLLNLEPPAEGQGRDLSPHFRDGPPPPQDRELFCESLLPTMFDANSLLGVVTDRWKYIQTTRPELYDLIADPQEMNNLIAEHGREQRAFQESLGEMLEQATAGRAADSAMDLDEEALEKLRSLGYVGGNVNEGLAFDQSKDDPKDLIAFSRAVKEAFTLSHEGKNAEAKAMLEKLLLERPQLPDVRGTLAMVEARLGNLPAAIEHYRKAIELDPDDARSHRHLGAMLEQQGALDEAIEHYEKAIELDPNAFSAHTNLGMILARRGDLAEATRHFLAAAATQPENGSIQDTLGAALFRQGEIDRAIEHFRLAVEADPGNARFQKNLAAALRAKQRQLRR